MKPKKIEASEPTEAEKALQQINGVIFAKGAPLGSPEYFAIRELCCNVLNKRNLPGRRPLGS